MLAENALLRQRLIVLRRGVARPAVTPTDRALLVLLAGRVRVRRRALLLVRPATLLRWHRAGFRALWRHKSRPGPGRPPLPVETVALIRRLAADNPRWGAERIRGELGKLGRRVAKRTIQTYGRSAAPPRPRGQTWAAFLRNHAGAIWARDFLPVTALAFRPLFAFFIIAPATPFDQRPRYPIRDNDGKYGASFASVAAASGITSLRTPRRAPLANATCERFLGGVRRACPDHLLVLGARHLAHVLHEYVAYFNEARPHRGRGHALPEPPADEPGRRTGPIRAVPVLGGLYHTYHRAA